MVGGGRSHGVGCGVACGVLHHFNANGYGMRAYIVAHCRRLKQNRRRRGRRRRAEGRGQRAEGSGTRKWE